MAALIPWPDYVGSYRLTEDPLRHGYASRRAAGLQLAEPRVLEGSYWIGKGRYVGEEQARARVHDFGVATVACPRDAPHEIVGLLQHNTLWVHPDHRRQGLALQMGLMHARLRISALPQVDGLWPCVIDVRRRPRDLRSRSTMYTHEGIELIRRVYCALVNEGLIDPGDGPWPTPDSVLGSSS